MKVSYVISTLLLVFITGCHSFNNEPVTSNIDLATSPDKPALTGENIISTSLYERDIAISPEFDEIIFTRGDYRQNRRCLVSIKKQGDNWEPPEVLNISGLYQDIEPFFSNNGDRLYFASNRPVYGDSSRNDYNIWFSDRKNGFWTEPVPLDSVINTRGDEFYPSLSREGNLFFTAIRENGIGMEDIFISTPVDGKYQSPEPLPAEINTSFYEFNAFVSPGEDYIIFSSYGRNEGSGGGDLYISRKDASGNWKKATNLGEKINSAGLDFCPFVDQEERNFYFTSDRINLDKKHIKNTEDLVRISSSIENGFGNIYQVRFEELQIKR